MNIEFV